MPDSPSVAIATPPASVSKRELRRRLRIILLMVLGAALLMEAGTRLYLFGWAGFSPRWMNSTHDLGEAGLIRTSADPQVLYELQPDLDTLFQLATFRTNSLGMRDRERSVEKPRDSFRIGVVGDSITMGQGVELEECHHFVLEQRLNEEGLRAEVLNFAVAGYNFRQDAAVIRDRMPAFAPDLVLVAFAFDDYKPISAEAQAARKLRPQPVSHEFFRCQFVRMLRRMVLRDDQTLAGTEEGRRGSLRAEELAYLEERAVEFAALQQTLGIPVVLAFMRLNHGTPEIAAQTRAILERHGLHFVDTSPEIVAAGKDFNCSPTNRHPDPEAHAIYAQVIHRELRAQGLLPVP